MLEFTLTAPNEELPPESLRRLYSAFLPGRLQAGTIRTRFTLLGELTPRAYRHADDYFSELETRPSEAEMREEHDDAYLAMRRTLTTTTVEFRASSQNVARQLLRVLNRDPHDDLTGESSTTKVFLGHGRDHQWRALRVTCASTPESRS